MTYQQQKINEERKRFLMWLWVAVITVAIVIGWVFTFRSAARQILAKPAPEDRAPAQIQDFQKQLQKSMDEFKKTWGEVKNGESGIKN